MNWFKKIVIGFINLLNRRKLSVILLVALVVASQFTFLKADSYSISEDNEYIMYNEALELYQNSTDHYIGAVERELVKNLPAIFNILQVITNTPPLNSRMDTFSNFGMGTLLAKFVCPTVTDVSMLSECLLSARFSIMEAILDHDDEDFTWNLEILNALAKQALMNEGYSEDEAERIILEGKQNEQGDEEGPPGQGGGSDDTPPFGF